MTIEKTPYDWCGVAFLTVKDDAGEVITKVFFGKDADANAAIAMLQSVLKHLTGSEATVVTNPTKEAPQVDWEDF